MAKQYIVPKAEFSRDVDSGWKKYKQNNQNLAPSIESLSEEISLLLEKRLNLPDAKGFELVEGDVNLNHPVQEFGQEELTSQVASWPHIRAAKKEIQRTVTNLLKAREDLAKLTRNADRIFFEFLTLVNTLYLLKEIYKAREKYEKCFKKCFSAIKTLSELAEKNNFLGNNDLPGASSMDIAFLSTERSVLQLIKASLSLSQREILERVGAAKKMLRESNRGGQHSESKYITAFMDRTKNDNEGEDWTRRRAIIEKMFSLAKISVPRPDDNSRSRKKLNPTRDPSLRLGKAPN